MAFVNDEDLAKYFKNFPVLYRQMFSFYDSSINTKRTFLSLIIGPTHMLLDFGTALRRLRHRQRIIKSDEELFCGMVD